MHCILYTVTGFLCLIKYIYTDKFLHQFFTKFDPVITSFVEVNVANKISAYYYYYYYYYIEL